MVSPQPPLPSCPWKLYPLFSKHFQSFNFFDFTKTIVKYIIHIKRIHLMRIILKTNNYVNAHKIFHPDEVMEHCHEPYSPLSVSS